MSKVLEYKTVIRIPDDGVGAFVEVPYNIEEVFGGKRVKVRATFDGEPYDGLVGRMGVYNEKGENIFLIIVPKVIREKIGKQGGDIVKVSLRRREE